MEKLVKRYPDPQLSIKIIYDRTIMVNFNPIDKDYIVRWQSDLKNNTKESILPVCDKPLHKIKENQLHWEELKNKQNSTFRVNS